MNAGLAASYLSPSGATTMSLPGANVIRISSFARDGPLHAMRAQRLRPLSRGGDVADDRVHAPQRDDLREGFFVELGVVGEHDRLARRLRHPPRHGRLAQ